MWQALVELLRDSSPWLVVLLLLTAGVIGFLWLISTGRFVTQGRHEDQKDGYEGRLSDCHEQLAQLTEDRDYWRDLALRAINVSEAAVARRREKRDDP